MKREQLFNDLLSLPSNTKEMFICRLFGLMETYEEEGKTLDPNIFFKMIESRVNHDFVYRKST